MFGHGLLAPTDLLDKLVCILNLKWMLAYEHLEEDDACTPKVYFLAVYIREQVSTEALQKTILRLTYTCMGL